MFDYFKMMKNQVHRFQPKVEISCTVGSYDLKTITTSEELIEALKLRYQVFHREMIGKTKSLGIDVDEFDFMCDHLIIKDRKTHQIVGTYRLNCSLFSKKFYSANEFEMTRVLAKDGVKLELGRACIHRDFRKGAVISLLWKGITLYMGKTNASTVFGCASVKTESARQAALLYKYFETQDLYRPNFFCPPKMKYAMPDIDLWIQSMDRDLSFEEMSEAKALVPSLCQAYINAGATLGGEPAYDEEYKCIDFLTILEKEDLNKALWKRHSAPSQPATHEFQITAS